MHILNQATEVGTELDLVTKHSFNLNIKLEIKRNYCILEMYVYKEIYDYESPIDTCSRYLKSIRGKPKNTRIIRM